MSFSIRKNIQFVDSIKDLIKKELKSSIPVGIKYKIKMFSHGFLSESYIIYSLAKNNHFDYLSVQIQLI